MRLVHDLSLGSAFQAAHGCAAKFRELIDTAINDWT